MSKHQVSLATKKDSFFANQQLTFKLLFILATFLSGINVSYAWTYTATGPWASFNFGQWTVYQNAWGAQNDYSAELYANSYSNFACRVNYTGGGIKNYCHVQGNPNLAIGSTWVTAGFGISVPNNAEYTAMYDLWTAGYQDELIVQEYWGDYGGGTWGTKIASNVTIGGRNYASIWQANNGSNNVIIFTPSSRRTSGNNDLMAYFTWCRDRGLLHNNTFYEISWGFEITSTSGWQQFTNDNFWASWGSPGSGGSNYVKIQNKASGLYVDGLGRSSNGSNAGQWSNSSSNNQQWIMETSGSYVKFKNRATGLYLDGMGRSSNGSLAGQWSSSSSNNQQWSVEDLGSYKRIKNRATGLYLDGMYWYSNGSDLGQWSNSGSDGQQWSITTVGSSARVASSEQSGEDVEEPMNSKVSVYPNPFISSLNIKVENPDEIKRILVVDMLGKEVEKIDHDGVSKLISVGSSFTPNMYMVKVYGTKWTKSYKVIKN